MNRATRRRNKGATTPMVIETVQHRRLKKLLPLFVFISILLLYGFIFVVYATKQYHNELGKVKLVGSDNSIMYVNEDGTFRWYRAKWEKDAVFDKDSDYLAGVMQYYTGDEAYEVLDKYSQHFFGFTSDNIQDMFDRTTRKEDIFIMIIKGVYFKENKNSRLVKDSSNSEIYYLGFKYNDGRTLQLYDHDNVSIFQFTVEDYDL